MRTDRKKREEPCNKWVLGISHDAHTRATTAEEIIFCPGFEETNDDMVDPEVLNKLICLGKEFLSAKERMLRSWAEVGVEDRKVLWENLHEAGDKFGEFIEEYFDRTNVGTYGKPDRHIWVQKWRRRKYDSPSK